MLFRSPLAGHYMTNNGALFSPLENTQIGQNIYITDLNHTYTYKIYSKKIVDLHDVYLVNNTKKPIITLITIIHCRLYLQLGYSTFLYLC